MGAALVATCESVLAGVHQSPDREGPPAVRQIPRAGPRWGSAILASARATPNEQRHSREKAAAPDTRDDPSNAVPMHREARMLRLFAGSTAPAHASHGLRKSAQRTSAPQNIWRTTQ